MSGFKAPPSQVLVELLLVIIASLFSGYAVIAWAVSGSMVMPDVLYVGGVPWAIVIIHHLWSKR